MKDILRAIQTLFPFLHDLRFDLKLWFIKASKNPHENDFKAIRQFKPKKDQVFLDIGSNRGEGIASTLACLNFDNQIIGFEPNQLVFEKLAKHFRNNSRVSVNNWGLGNKNEELILYVPFYRRWMFDGLSSFKYESAANWLKTRLWRYKEEHLQIRELKCQIRKLDDMKLNPYFIKIDVQGFELEVLKGGEATLKKHQPILLIESIEEDVIDFLKVLNYSFYKFQNGKLTAGLGTLNTFCIGPSDVEILSL